MDLPWLAIYRTVEQSAATDARYRREIERSGRPLLGAYRARSDEDLCAELRRLDVVVTRESFAALAAGHDSAQSLLGQLRRSRHRLQGFESDSAWFCLWVLWERWLPERPSCEQVDDWVAEGCRRARDHDYAAACAAWLRAWGFVRDLARARSLRRLDDVDAVLRGSELFFNWVQDFEAALHNAGLQDPAWQREGVRFCQEYLALFEQADQNVTEHMRRALAGFYYGLNESDVADRLYEEWLGADPRWGWGWIGWSDEYGLWQPPKDVARAEQLLQRGLAVPGVRDERDMLDRLQSLYADTGREDEARAVRKRLETYADAADAASAPPQTVVRPAPKVGRNDPCPCGSGKKYKKCCLK